MNPDQPEEENSPRFDEMEGTRLIVAFCNAVDLLQAGRADSVPLALLAEMRDRLLLTLGPDRIDSDEALQIKRKRGAPSKEFKHFQIAAQVQELVDIGMTDERAFEAVARSLPEGKSDDRTGTVRNIYQSADKEKVRRQRALRAVIDEALRKTQRTDGDETE